MPKKGEHLLRKSRFSGPSCWYSTDLNESVRLQNTYMICRHAEKTLQLVRILQAEVQKAEAAKFVVFFSTCAAVDYFYRVRREVPPTLNHKKQ